LFLSILYPEYFLKKGLKLKKKERKKIRHSTEYCSFKRSSPEWAAGEIGATTLGKNAVE